MVVLAGVASGLSPQKAFLASVKAPLKAGVVAAVVFMPLASMAEEHRPPKFRPGHKRCRWKILEL